MSYNAQRAKTPTSDPFICLLQGKLDNNGKGHHISPGIFSAKNLWGLSAPLTSSRKWWGQGIWRKIALGDSFLNRKKHLFAHSIVYIEHIYCISFKWLHGTEIDYRSEGNNEWSNEITQCIPLLSFCIYGLLKCSVRMQEIHILMTLTVRSVVANRNARWSFVEKIVIYESWDSGVSADRKKIKQCRSPHERDGVFINLSHRVCTFDMSHVVFSHPWGFTA